LKREHHSGEKPRQQNDGQRLYADGVHLLHNVAAVEWARKHKAERLARKDEKFLQGKNLSLHCIVEAL